MWTIPLPIGNLHKPHPGKNKEAKAGYRKGKDISHVTYIDDITVTIESWERLKKIAKKIKEKLKKRGLKINATKTVLAERKETGKSVEIRGKQVEAVTGKEVTRFLGIWTNLELDWNDQEERIKKTVTLETNKLKRMLFSTKQKITLVNTVLTPGSHML
jgi:hypothetical protein